eukprot:7143908-Alexandrium_andersonii.AAC.1
MSSPSHPTSPGSRVSPPGNRHGRCTCAAGLGGFEHRAIGMGGNERGWAYICRAGCLPGLRRAVCNSTGGMPALLHSGCPCGG